jgi:hypothetical protein
MVTEAFVNDVLEVCNKHGLLPVNYIRNIKIKKRYKELIDSGLPGKEARDKLADEFYIGNKCVEYIIYDLGNK